MVPAGGWIDIKATDAEGRAPKEAMLLNVGLRSDGDVLDLEVQPQRRGVGLDERDRARGVASALCLQHGQRRGEWAGRGAGGVTPFLARPRAGGREHYTCQGDQQDGDSSDP